jgi:hypothetical protein
MTVGPPDDEGVELANRTHPHSPRRTRSVRRVTFGDHLAARRPRAAATGTSLVADAGDRIVLRCIRRSRDRRRRAQSGAEAPALGAALGNFGAREKAIRPTLAKTIERARSGNGEAQVDGELRVLWRAAK